MPKISESGLLTPVENISVGDYIFILEEQIKAQGPFISLLSQYAVVENIMDLSRSSTCSKFKMIVKARTIDGINFFLTQDRYRLVSPSEYFSALIIDA